MSVVLDTLSKLPDSAPTTMTNRNISQTETTALNQLRNDDTIIIKEADKGGTTVIMEKTFYKDKTLELLTDGDNYAELTNNEDDETMKKSKA